MLNREDGPFYFRFKDRLGDLWNEMFDKYDVEFPASPENEEAFLRRLFLDWSIGFLISSLRDRIFYERIDSGEGDKNFQVWMYQGSNLPGIDAVAFSGAQYARLRQCESDLFDHKLGGQPEGGFTDAQFLDRAEKYLKSIVENFDECFPQKVISRLLTHRWKLEDEELSDKVREYYRAALTRAAADMLEFVGMLRREGAEKELAVAINAVAGKSAARESVPAKVGPVPMKARM